MNRQLKPCSHRASVLTLTLMHLNWSRTHLNFDARMDADADTWCEWYTWNQCILFKHQQYHQGESQHLVLLKTYKKLHEFLFLSLDHILLLDITDDSPFCLQSKTAKKWSATSNRSRSRRLHSIQKIKNRNEYIPCLLTNR